MNSNLPENEMSYPRYYLTREVTKQEYMDEEQNCGFHPKVKGETATAAFSAGNKSGRMESEAGGPNQLFREVTQMKQDISDMHESVTTSFVRCRCGHLHDNGWRCHHCHTEYEVTPEAEMEERRPDGGAFEQFIDK